MDPKEGKQVIKNLAIANGYEPDTDSDDELAEFFDERRNLLRQIIPNAIFWDLVPILNWVEKYRLVDVDDTGQIFIH